MKKRTKKIDSWKSVFCPIAIAAISGMFFSCAKEELDMSKLSEYGTPRNIRIFGVMESGVNTDKAHMDVNDRYVYWDEGDEVKINNAILAAEPDGENPTMAVLNGSVSPNTKAESGKDVYRGVFPSTLAENIGNASGPLSITLPEQQPFANGVPKTNFMVGRIAVEQGCTSFTLPFKNICAMMKIGLTASASASDDANTVRQIILSSSSHALSGSASVNFGSDSTPSLTMEGSGGIVSLDCTNNGSGGILLTATPTYFYLMVPAYTGELTMNVINKEGKGMKKKVSSFTFERNLVYTSTAEMIINNDDPHIFELCDGTKINIAKGNLQYNQTNGFRFAEHSYSMIGGAEFHWDNVHNTGWIMYAGGVLTENNNRNDNETRASTEWIDMFGWGTSGYDCGNNVRLNGNPSGNVRELNHGIALFQPYAFKGGSYEGYDWHAAYGPAGFYNLTGTYANCDWGVYNDIKSYDGTVTYTKGTWRTPTKEEWDCLINKPEKYGYAQMIDHRYTDYNGQPKALSGCVLIPTGFIDPKVGDGGKAFISAKNTADGQFSDNQYTEATWIQMEKAGAIFLPESGVRNNFSIDDASCVGHGGIKGCYWSSTCSEDDSRRAYLFRMENEYMSGRLVGARTETDMRSAGVCVRLIKNAE